MSQIIKSLASGPVPPTVPTSFVTDDGTAIPLNNVLNVNGAFTNTSVDNGIQTQAIPNDSDNLLIVLTNRLFGGTSTVGVGPADIITFPLASGTATAYQFHFQIVGRDVNTGDSLGYTIFGAAKTNGTLASIIETPYIDIDQDPSLITGTASLVVSGNDVILQVSGVTGHTISYKALGTYIQI